jgi:putative ABC transport system ATP-binding protein
MMEGNNIIQAIDLTKVYRNGVEVKVIDRIRLSVQDGEFLAITGPSGSGKSTLLNLIGTLDTPTEGDILVNRVDLKTLKGNALADFRLEHIGFVFQAFNLIPVLSALENVMLPLIPYQRNLDFNLKEQARNLLVSMGLGHRADHFPSQLSGGEQQRVAIARALVNTPKIILADEPTGNVDSKAGEEIANLLKELNQDRGVTVILVTHNEALTRYAKRVLQLRDGKIY